MRADPFARRFVVHMFYAHPVDMALGNAATKIRTNAGVMDNEASRWNRRRQNLSASDEHRRSTRSSTGDG